MSLVFGVVSSISVVVIDGELSGGVGRERGSGALHGFVFWVIGLWGHGLVIIRVTLVFFIIIEGTGDLGTCCIEGQEWGEVRDKGHCCFLIGYGYFYSQGALFEV